MKHSMKPCRLPSGEYKMLTEYERERFNASAVSVKEYIGGVKQAKEAKNEIGRNLADKFKRK